MKEKEPIYVVRPVLPPLERYNAYVKQIFDNQYLTNQGPLHQQFTKELSKMIDNDDINLFCNGHMALECALNVLDMKKGGEIITTPYTFISTTNSIINAGFKPIFCDIKLTDYTIDEDKIEELITDKTVAIMPVHVYGYPCNVKKIEKIAKKHNLKVIYDAAHAFAVKVDGKSIFNYGDVSMTSFHSTKLFHTIEGGMTVSNTKNGLPRKLDATKNFGIDLITGEFTESGVNAKMNEFAAAMGLSLLPELESIISKRKKIVELYREELKNIPGIIVSKEQKNVEYNYAYFPIVIDETKYIATRDELCDYLMENNIYSRKYFYPLCNSAKYIKNKQKKTPNAQYASDRVLSLPIYPTLDKKVVTNICNLIKKLYDIKANKKGK